MKTKWLKTYQQSDYVGELFDVCRNRSRGNPNSDIAFQAVADRRSEGQMRVLNCIRDAGERGRTTDEIAFVLGATPNEISPRVSELKRDGKIYSLGTRPTRRGHPAAVLKAV